MQIHNIKYHSFSQRNKTAEISMEVVVGGDREGVGELDKI